jgi:hypothetical protein
MLVPRHSLMEYGQANRLFKAIIHPVSWLEAYWVDCWRSYVLPAFPYSEWTDLTLATPIPGFHVLEVEKGGRYG